MKFILLAIFVLFAAQPLQASPCDMGTGQDKGHSQHGNMNDTLVDHENMQDMDCCDQDPNETGDGCGSMSHCGSCPAGMAVIHPVAFGAVFDSNTQPLFNKGNEPPSRFGSPPFRPPIA
jgi:hypothetical protein